MRVKQKPPNGWMPVPETRQWHVAVVFYLSNAFGERDNWVRGRGQLTIRPGETWQAAYKREFGESPKGIEQAFVSKKWYGIT